MSIGRLTDISGVDVVFVGLKRVEQLGAVESSQWEGGLAKGWGILGGLRGWFRGGGPGAGSG